MQMPCPSQLLSVHLLQTWNDLAARAFSDRRNLRAGMYLGKLRSEFQLSSRKGSSDTLREMKLPVDVNSWDFETVLEIVRSSTLEPYEFEFKATVDPKGEDADVIRSSIRKCACSMANSDGGYIIFGVQNRGNTPEERIVGIEAGQDWSSRVDRHAKEVRPQISFSFTRNPILLPKDESKCVFVVHIPPSPRRPHEFEGRFYRRNHGGSAEYMSALEVRDMSVYTEERFSKLTLLRIHLAQLKAVSEMMRMGDAAVQMHCSHRFDVSAINQLVAETCRLFPVGNSLLRDLSTMVTQALCCNGVFEKLNQLAAAKPFMTDSGKRWLAQSQELSFSVGHYCRTTEEALAKVYGEVKP